jgi:hypothetical protein
MKRCPTCQRTYPDDAPGFCVNDGTALATEEPQGYDPQKTMMASAPPPPPQPQYSNPQPPPPMNQPPQAAWPPTSPSQPPPQQQGQNWGGYNQQPGQYAGYPPQQYGAPAVAAGGKGLSLASFITGIISFLALALIFLMSQRVIDPDLDVAKICFYGSAALGLIAIVLGALALISKRQRNKWMAILGLVLGIPAILFCIYVLTQYNYF